MRAQRGRRAGQSQRSQDEHGKQDWLWIVAKGRASQVHLELHQLSVRRTTQQLLYSGGNPAIIAHTPLNDSTHLSCCKDSATLISRSRR